ncbi:hypothetical protein HPC49_37400 [Pyxidicoccus fallax]|uniref:Lipoprotein n=1 Tax=Pyxidicoccus fallax TaxID=394095 RepID=A0A848L660_9BACT|nr:hypothetical protein [Pyxidicoccus fallax]NMO14096.1 hypothetical protein [Pyxidicoccus fallax]NPC83878.1 hypothetical protein [Pyxidicoccus fallax]
MQAMLRGALLCSLFVAVGCRPGAVRPTPPPEEQPSVTAACDDTQKAISQAADTRASPYGIDQHVEKNFKDRKVSWLMPEALYQKFVVQTGAKNFGRCNDSGCFLFAAPTATIQEAVTKSMVDGKHDPAVIGQALGLPAKNFEGPLRMMTLDLAASKSCARLPVDEDPGVWKCQTPEDTDCFKFGGYTSGGIPEIMVINAPVDQATVAEIP